MTRHNVKHYPLDVELTRKPRCGLCSFYPLEAGNTYNCPIKEEVVHRVSKPPKARAHANEMKHFICFHPMTELAWQTYFKIRRHRESEGYKKRRRLNPEPHREHVRQYRIENPEKIKEWRKNWEKENATWLRIKRHRNYLKHREEKLENSRFRNQIERYNPMKRVMDIFSYYRRQIEKGAQLRSKTAEEKAERKLIYETIRAYDPVWRVTEKIRMRVRYEDQLEYRRWRRIIREYDPMLAVEQKFKAARERIRDGKSPNYTPRKSRHPIEDIPLGIEGLEAPPDAPTEPYIPQSLPEIVVGYSGSDARGGVDKLWKSHPDAYRKRNLKFARLDMQ